jgi:hypothetical protein
LRHLRTEHGGNLRIGDVGLRGVEVVRITEPSQVGVGLPAFVDVDALGVEGVGGLDEVEAPGCPAGLHGHSGDHGQVAVPVGGRHTQRAGDDDHGAASASTSSPGTGTRSAAKRPAAAAARK